MSVWGEGWRGLIGWVCECVCGEGEGWRGLIGWVCECVCGGEGWRGLIGNPKVLALLS